MSGIQNYKSHFSQLLATFHVSGTELADILHIDASLVSKWKNNKRSLKSNSPFMDSITDYFISLDTISGYATLRELLSTEHINFDSLSEEQLKITFKRWLLSAVDNSENDFSLQDLESQCKKGKAYSYLQFQGNAGKRDAVLGLLRHAASLPPPRSGADPASGRIPTLAYRGRHIF